MTKAQRDRIVQLLKDGATLHEAASIAQVPWPEFTRVWNVSRREHEGGKSTVTVGSRWYSLCQAERAAYKATLRATAQAKAGTKASSDNLALLKYLESEEDPHDEQHSMGASIPVEDPLVRDLGVQLLKALADAQQKRAGM